MACSLKDLHYTTVYNFLKSQNDRDEKFRDYIPNLLTLQVRKLTARCLEVLVQGHMACDDKTQV